MDSTEKISQRGIHDAIVPLSKSPSYWTDIAMYPLTKTPLMNDSATVLY